MNMEAIYSFFSAFIKVETLQGAWKTLVLANISLVVCSPLFLLSYSFFLKYIYLFICGGFCRTLK